MNIGFIGLGAMGSAIASRLIGAGHQLTLYNRSKERYKPFSNKDNIHFASTPALCAQKANVLFSMLKDDQALTEIAEGENGFLSSLPPHAVHVCCSTISVQCSKYMASRHKEINTQFLAAPVLGRPSAAASGQLYSLLAGPEPAKYALMPLLEQYSQKIFDLGSDTCNAHLVKLSLNFLILSTVEQMAEVFAVTEKHGLDTHTVLDVLTSSFFSSPIYKNYGSLMVDKSYLKPGKAEADISLLYKDISLFLSAGHNLETPLPLASFIQNRLLQCIAQGDSDKDFTILSEYARKDAGLDRK